MPNSLIERSRRLGLRWAAPFAFSCSRTFRQPWLRTLPGPADPQIGSDSFVTPGSGPPWLLSGLLRRRSK